MGSSEFLEGIASGGPSRPRLLVAHRNPLARRHLCPIGFAWLALTEEAFGKHRLR